MNPNRQIVALGGGGFSDDPQDLNLDRFILSLVEVKRPSVCFLAAASGDAESYRYKFYESFSQLDCQPSHLSLFDLPSADLESFVLSKDIIYVGGGNTKSMLALWREWSLDSILRKAWGTGIVLAGVSAGAICWFEQGVTDSVPGALLPLPCLGFLAGSCCPHYDGDPARRPAYSELIKSGAISPGVGIDDWAAVHYVKDHIYQVLSGRPSSSAYSVALVDGEIQESKIDPTTLLYHSN